MHYQPVYNLVKTPSKINALYEGCRGSSQKIISNLYNSHIVCEKLTVHHQNDIRHRADYCKRAKMTL